MEKAIQVKVRNYIAPAKNLTKEYQNLRSRKEVTVKVKLVNGWFVQRMWYCHGYGYKHSEWLMVYGDAFPAEGQFVIAEADYKRLVKSAFNGKLATVTADVQEYRIKGYPGQMRHYSEPIARIGDRVQILHPHCLHPLTVIVKPKTGHCFEMWFKSLKLPTNESDTVD